VLFRSRAPQRRPACCVRVGAELLGGPDGEALARRLGDVGDRDGHGRVGAHPARVEPELVLARAATPGERRGTPQRRQTADQPVNFGPLLRLVVDMMKCVCVTIWVTAGRLSGSSNGPATGDLPASRRIHAAWRASTEWIASAEAR